MSDTYFRTSAAYYKSTTALAAYPGPATSDRYAFVVGTGLFQWFLGDVTAADGSTILAPQGGSIGRWKLVTDPTIISLPWKPSARTAATSNIALSGLQTVNGVTLVANDRVLVTGQTDPTQNGLYVAAAGAWSRAADAIIIGFTIKVLQGTYAGEWVLTSPSAGTIALGATALTFLFTPQPSVSAATNTLVQRDGAAGIFASAVNTSSIVSTGPVSANAANGATLGAAGSDVILSPGMGNIDGTDAHGNFVVNLGKVASAHGYQSGSFVLKDDQGIAVDQPLYGDVTGSKYWKPQTRTGLGLRLDSGAELILTARVTGQAVQIEAPISGSINETYNLSGNIYVKRYKMASFGSVNGANTITIFPDTILNTSLVPYQHYAHCLLKIKAISSDFNTVELWEVPFTWWGGQANLVVANVWDTYTQPTLMKGSPARTSGVSSRMQAATPTTVGTITYNTPSGVNGGKLNIQFTGLAGVNFADVYSDLDISVGIGAP